MIFPRPQGEAVIQQSLTHAKICTPLTSRLNNIVSTRHRTDYISRYSQTHSRMSKSVDPHWAGTAADPQSRAESHLSSDQKEGFGLPAAMGVEHKSRTVTNLSATKKA